MIKHFYLTFFFAIVLTCTQATYAQAQKRLVKARVVDSKNLPVDYATVSVLSAADSSVVRSTVTGKDGLLEVDGLANGNYCLLVSQLGLKNHSVPFTISAQKPNVDLGTITMEPEIRNLKEVNVSALVAPVTIKKDTVEFNAKAYKTQQNDNVEQLFKKLPGVDVDKDGKITAQGKEVTKVLVDGKEFFGNDPKAVTKNLPADAIDKVQIIDDKTDKAKNTGIDDGQREKVMNVTLKADKKKGWFGNASLAGGNSQRYLGQLNMNRFDNKKQISLLSLTNNVNESGFTFEDINNFAGGNAFSAFGSADGSNNINISANGRANVNGAFNGVDGGLITNHTAGLNYTDEYGKDGKLKFNTSFVTVLSKNNIVQTSDIQDIPNGLYTNQFSRGNNTSNSYRLSVNLDYKLDSLTNIKFKPNFGLTHKQNYSQSASGTTKAALTDSVNNIRQLLDQTSNSPNFGGQFTVNHRFPRGKGSINFYSTGNYSAYNADYTNQANARFFVSSQPNTNNNQQASQDSRTSFITSTASFIRQLSKAKKINMNVSETVDLRKQNADQYTVDYNAVTGNYEIFNPMFSGNTDNRSHRYTSTLGLNKSADSYSINLNMAVAQLGLDGTSFSNGVLNNVSRDAWAFIPNASFNYRQKNGRSINFSIFTDVSLPAATDLQTVFNNTNPQYIRQGNADLFQSRTVYFNFNYNYFDMKSNNYINIYTNYNTTQNGFSTQSSVVNGITTSKPINVDGNYNYNLGINIGHPTKIKGFKYNVSTNTSIQHTVNVINGNTNAVTRFRPSLGAGANFDRDSYQFGLRVYGTYNNAKNSYQSLADRAYFTYYNTINASVLPVKTWRIFSDVLQNLYRGQPANANTSFYVWNAGVERYFLKNKNLTLSLNAFDLLDQNTGNQRSINSTGVITNNLTNTIGRYFYLKMILKLTKVGAPENKSGVIIMR